MSLITGVLSIAHTWSVSGHAVAVRATAMTVKPDFQTELSTAVSIRHQRGASAVTDRHVDGAQYCCINLTRKTTAVTVRLMELLLWRSEPLSALINDDVHCWDVAKHRLQ